MAPDFERVGARYEALVEESIRFSGRDHGFFLAAKARVLHDLVARRLGDPGTVAALDVGCGAGALHPYLRRFERLEAVDPAPSLVDEARAANDHVSYTVADGTALPFDDGSFDLAFTVCVLHHVERGRRAAFAAELARVVRPGGLAVVFEHNPLNPLTRLAVSRCAFDEDAELLGPRETVTLLRGAELIPTDRRYVLFFPWTLPRAERALARVPLGAQYLVAGRR